MIEDFKAKYGIEVDRDQPDVNSQEEIDALNNLAGTDAAPDVLDLAPTVALANTDLFAPYQVAAWADIPDDLKEADAASGSATTPASCPSAATPVRCAARHRGRPAEARVQGHGRAERQPDERGRRLQRRGHGVAGERRLGRRHRRRASSSSSSSTRRATSCRSTRPRRRSPPGRRRASSTGSTTTPRQTGALEGQGIDWQVVVPSDAPPVASYYIQAINKEAPHPAAARLWQEFLFSPEGQNMWLKGFARPVLQDKIDRRRDDRPGRARRASPRRRARPVVADPGADRGGPGIPERELGHRRSSNRGAIRT